MTNLTPKSKPVLLCAVLMHSLFAFSQKEIDLTDRLVDTKSKTNSIDYIFPDGTLQFKVGNGIYKMQPDGTIHDPQYYHIAEKPVEVVTIYPFKTEQIRMRHTDNEHAINYIVTTDSIIVEKMHADRPNEFLKYPLPMVHHPRKTNDVIRSCQIKDYSLDFLDKDHVLYSEVINDRCAESDAKSAKGKYKADYYLRMITVNLNTGESSQVITMINEFNTNWEPMFMQEDDMFSLGPLWNGKKTITRVSGKGKPKTYSKTNTATKIEGKGTIELIGVDVNSGKTSVLDAFDYTIAPEYASYRINLNDQSAVIQRSAKVGKDQFKPELTMYEIVDGRFVQSSMSFPDEFVTISPGLSNIYVLTFGKKQIPYIEVQMVDGTRDRTPVTAYAYLTEDGLQVFKGYPKRAYYNNQRIPVSLIDEVSAETVEQLTKDFNAIEGGTLMFGIHNGEITGYNLNVTDKRGAGINIHAVVYTRTYEL